jgi:hypothetical protein
VLQMELARTKVTHALARGIVADLFYLKSEIWSSSRRVTGGVLE